MFSDQTLKHVREAISADYGIALDQTETIELTQRLVGYFDLLWQMDYEDKNGNGQRLIYKTPT